jgi:hypothetical protein
MVLNNEKPFVSFAPKILFIPVLLQKQAFDESRHKKNLLPENPGVRFFIVAGARLELATFGL